MLKNILISLGSIMGVLLAIFLAWSLLLNDDPKTSAVNGDENVQEVGDLDEEENQESSEDDALTDQGSQEEQNFFRSELKIVNVE